MGIYASLCTAHIYYISLLFKEFKFHQQSYKNIYKEGTYTGKGRTYKGDIHMEGQIKETYYIREHMYRGIYT